MKNNEKSQIVAPFNEFFKYLVLKDTELENLRQDLIKAGVIVEIEGKDHVIVRECAEYVSDELDKLAIKAVMSRSDEDINNYAFTSLGYLRVWHYHLGGCDLPKESFESKDAVNSLRIKLNQELSDYHQIYGHVLSVLEVSMGINLSKYKNDRPEEDAINHNNLSGDGWDKKQLIEDEDCVTLGFPLEEFNHMLKFSGSEMVQRHQNLTEKIEIAKINGREHVLLTRYGIYVLDDLEYLHSRTSIFHSEDVIEDYLIFSFQYLYFWTLLLMGRCEFETAPEEKVTDAFIQGGWEKALAGFQAIYRHARNSIVVSVENELSVSSEK